MNAAANAQDRIFDLVPDWTRETPFRPRSAQRYVTSLDLVVRSGIVRLDQISRDSMRGFLSARQASGTSQSTCKKDLSAVLSFCRWAEEHGRYSLASLTEVRQIKVRLPRTPPPAFLTREEFGRLLAASRGYRPILGLAVNVAAHTGARQGEFRTLMREDLVLEGPTPYVRLKETLGRRIKTGRQRTVPVAQAFARELLRPGALPSSGPIFPAGGGKKSFRPSSSIYISGTTLERMLAKAREAASLPPTVNFITLRHSYASWLVQGNVSIAKVASWLGNDVGTCFRHYSALAPGGDLEVERGFRP